MTTEQRSAFLQSGRRWAGQAPGSVVPTAPAASLLNTGLAGPLPLRFEQVRGAIDRVAPGVYALGYPASDDGFCVLLVGRSDTDVRAALINHIGTHRLFKYILTATPLLAFEKECELFHNFSPPTNRRHPERTGGTKWTCPRCRQFGR